MNSERILAVADAIEQHSIPWLGFNMSSFFAHNDYVDRSGHNCGTTACIAGWAYTLKDEDAVGEALSRIAADRHRNWDGLNAEGIANSAERWLDLTYEQADELFWPPDIMHWRYIMPDQAIRVLRYLAATGIVDWTV